MNLPKEAWIEWLQQDTTRQFLQYLHETREDLKEGMAEGQAGDLKELYITVGRCQSLRDVIEGAKQLAKQGDENSAIDADFTQVDR